MRRAIVVGAVSVAAHLLVLVPLFGPALWTPTATPLQPSLTQPVALVGQARNEGLVDAVAKARRELVDAAVLARKQSRLELGAFLIDAALIDAAELGLPLDDKEARRRYELAQGELRKVRRQQALGALRRVYGHLGYSSVGGSMADALLDGYGSCEQLSHLLAASVHDAGLDHKVQLQVYSDHLVPVMLFGETAVDLVSGGPVAAGGVRVPAVELIEVYARKHGLLPRLPQLGASQQWSDGRPSFAGGYPGTSDAFGGMAPLFARRALGEVNGSAGSTSAPAASGCPANALRYEIPQQITMLSPRFGSYSIELRNIPEEASLLYRASAIEAWEKGARSKEDFEAVVVLSCSALAYQEFAVDLAIAGRQTLSRVSSERSIKARDQARELFAALPDGMRSKALVTRILAAASDPESFPVAAEAWALIALPEAAPLLHELVMSSLPNVELALFSVPLLQTLMDHEHTRAALVAAASKLPLNQRISFTMRIGMLLRNPEWLETLPDGEIRQALRATQLLRQSMHEADKLTRDELKQTMLEAGYPRHWLKELGLLPAKE